MTKIASVKVLKSPRSHWQLSDAKYTGDEPVWNTEQAMKMDDATFDNAVRKSMNYYNYYFGPKDLKKYVDEFVRITGKFKENEIKLFDKVAEKDVPITLCSLVVAHKSGMPLRGKYGDYVSTTIKSLIDRVKASKADVDKQEGNAAPVITIQDRLNEKTNELMGMIEGELDLVFQNKSSTFKPFEFLTGHNVPQSQLSKYDAVFNGMLIEFKTAQKSTDEQVKESYRHYKNSDYKRIFAFFESLLEAVQQYKGVKRATKKARAKKPINKQKQVSRVKYCKEFTELKLVSINPAEVLGAGELWVYNTKTRKLGKYVADEFATLSIKGTSITNFSETKSVSKTLRKPADQLKEFAKANKVQLRKFLDSIRSVETRMNGRINADVVLLKAL